MKTTTPDTFFDSPQRSKPAELKADLELINSQPIIKTIIDAFPDICLLLNKHREAVAYNKNSLSYFNIDKNEIIGSRLGDLLKCLHTKENPSGCGTSKSCRNCDAAKSIKISNDSLEVVSTNCIIASKVHEREMTLNFKLNITPLVLDETHFSLLTLRDISKEIKAEFLEQVFFHDIINTAGAIYNLANYFETADFTEKTEIGKIIVKSSKQLLREIEFQRELRSAEEGTLKINLELISVNEIIKTVSDFYENHHLAKNKLFRISLLEDDITIKTDPVLLIRSLGNVIKNAFESTEEEDCVCFKAITDNSFVVFQIKNNYNYSTECAKSNFHAFIFYQVG